MNNQIRLLTITVGLLLSCAMLSAMETSKENVPNLELKVTNGMDGSITINTVGYKTDLQVIDSAQTKTIDTSAKWGTQIPTKPDIEFMIKTSLGNALLLLSVDSKASTLFIFGYYVQTGATIINKTFTSFDPKISSILPIKVLGPSNIEVGEIEEAEIR
jgi:hypothetical protein